MADMNFKLDFTNKEKLKESIDAIVRVAELVSNIVPNESVKKFVVYFKRVAETDWVIEAIIWINTQLNNKDNTITLSVA